MSSNRALILSLLIGTACAQAFAAEFHCPPTIGVTQSAEAAGDGWTVPPVQTRHTFQSVGISDGPPAELAWLKPQTSAVRKGVGQVVWALDHLAGDAWVACSYQGTAVQAMRRLPEKLQRCTARYALSDTDRPVVLDCR